MISGSFNFYYSQPRQRIGCFRETQSQKLIFSVSCVATCVTIRVFVSLCVFFSRYCDGEAAFILFYIFAYGYISELLLMSSRCVQAYIKESFPLVYVSLVNSQVDMFPLNVHFFVFFFNLRLIFFVFDAGEGMSCIVAFIYFARTHTVMRK